MKTSLLLLAGSDGPAASPQLVSRLASNGADDGEWQWRTATFSIGPVADGPARQPNGHTGVPVSADISMIVGWAILDALGDVDLVHLFSPFTRAGEVAVLAAKTLGKPLALSALGGSRQSELGRSLGLVELADVLILEHPAELSGPANQPSFLFDSGDRDAAAWLGAIYDGVIDARERSA